MPESIKLEKQLIQTLKKSGVSSIEDKAAEGFLSQIKNLTKKKKINEAAAHYAALASTLGKDSNLALQAARAYHKAGNNNRAAHWYLIASERYAEQYQSSKAIATLRIYNQLNPEDTINPKRIYDLCLKHGGENISPPSIILSEADRAGPKLMANDFFSAFDSANFDRLIQSLTYHKYQDGEVINKMGEKATSLYIVISGAVSGYLTLNNKRTYLGDIGEDNIFGETAYFTGGRRTAESVAHGETEVFELPYTLLDEFKQSFPSFNKRIEKLYRERMLVKQLALTTLFENARAQCREWIAPRMRPVTLKSGETLFNQNDKSIDLYLVRAGRLAVTINIDGKEKLLKTTETGAILGEVAIVAKKQRTASVRALTDCVLMKLDGEDYESFYNSSKVIQSVLAQIKKKHVMETFDLMKNNKRIEGDDTCEVLLKDIWKN